MTKAVLLTMLDKFVQTMNLFFGKLPQDLLDVFKEIRYFIVHEEKV